MTGLVCCVISGSSPRMRGTHAFNLANGLIGGIIPAYAGNTDWSYPLLRHSRDHPRVCGEHRNHRTSRRDTSGSSPRMRGTRDAQQAGYLRGGIIPAYAGNTLRFIASSPSTWDHPRVCGEHTFYDVFRRSAMGSSPRMRGTPEICLITLTPAGIIPAYAGNTYAAHYFRPVARDHPRVCGEHPICAANPEAVLGSSPRMRGTRTTQPTKNRQRRIIPAYAGNTSHGICRVMDTWDHPRVCGEHQCKKTERHLAWGSSPRMRGTHGFHAGLAQVFGIIPAYAGNTLDAMRDHASGSGSSPRMRGTRFFY